MNVIKMLPRIGNPSAILDAGSGDGAYSFYLARRFPEAIVHGVEVSRVLVNKCQQLRSTLGLENLLFRSGSLTKLSAPEAYDLIVCIDVLEHIAEDDRALLNLRGALTERGYLILHVPQKRQLNRFVLHPLGHAYVREHVREEYTQEEIESKIAKAGLRICERKYTFGWAGSLAREVYYLLNEQPGWWWYPARLASMPLLLGLSWLDTRLCNREHQGFLYKLAKAPCG